MRKVIVILLVGGVLAGCVRMKYGQGGVNAVQYVKEQVPELRGDIDKVEIVGEDSVLSDFGIIFGKTILARSCSEYLEGSLSKDEFENVIDSLSHDATDVEDSWLLGEVVNDSLKTVVRYDGMWRKVYKVRVTLKSMDTREARVMMDQDGVTPRMMEKDMDGVLRDFTDKILAAGKILRAN